MLDQETLAQHQERLAIYRRSLAHLLKQAAQYGGEVYAPTQVANSIHEARAEIQRIKNVLRTNGIDVGDLPDDDPQSRVPILRSRWRHAIFISLVVIAVALGITVAYVALYARILPVASMATASVLQSPTIATPRSQPHPATVLTPEIPQAADVALLISFDEGAGDTAADASGHSNHGRLQGGFGQTWNEGKVGTGLYFDGASLVHVEDSESLRFTAQVTVEAWIRPAVIDNKTRNIVAKISPTDGFAFRLFLRNGYPIFDIYSDGGEGRAEGVDQLIANRWYRVVGAYDGRYIRIFIDGAEVRSIPYAKPIRPAHAWLAIGSSAYQNEFFFGDIDEVKISGR